MKPHKHCELIKAWADGAEIEARVHGKWVDADLPLWDNDTEYRIKPEPVVLYVNEYDAPRKYGDFYESKSEAESYVKDSRFVRTIKLVEAEE